MNTLAKRIGNAIKAARISIGLTQEEVAVRLGIGRAAYSNIENGYSNITIDHLLKLPQILHKPVTYYLDIDIENLTAEEAEWLELYRILPPDVRALVFTFARVAAQQATE